MTDVAQAVRRALEEDIGAGDVTSEACVPANRRASGLFIGRQRFVLAGTEVLSLMFDDIVFYKHDGDIVTDGEIHRRSSRPGSPATGMRTDGPELPR